MAACRRVGRWEGRRVGSTAKAPTGRGRTVRIRPEAGAQRPPRLHSTSPTHRGHKGERDERALPAAQRVQAGAPAALRSHACAGIVVLLLGAAASAAIAALALAADALAPVGKLQAKALVHLGTHLAGGEGRREGGTAAAHTHAAGLGIASDPVPAPTLRTRMR